MKIFAKTRILKMINQEYNGFVNKPTWLTNMLMDCGLYYDFIRQSRTSLLVLQDYGAYCRYEVDSLESYLRETTLETLDITSAGNILVKELLRFSYEQIDFRELAKNLIEEFDSAE